MDRKIWNIADSPPKEFLESFPEYSRVTLQMLWNRNIRTKDEINSFLNVDYERDNHDPYLYKDMDKAVEIVAEAALAKEKIHIFGDYDHDGISGAAILKLFLFY